MGSGLATPWDAPPNCHRVPSSTLPLGILCDPAGDVIALGDGRVGDAEPRQFYLKKGDTVGGGVQAGQGKRKARPRGATGASGAAGAGARGNGSRRTRSRRRHSQGCLVQEQSSEPGAMRHGPCCHMIWLQAHPQQGWVRLTAGSHPAANRPHPGRGCGTSASRSGLRNMHVPPPMHPSHCWHSHAPTSAPTVLPQVLYSKFGFMYTDVKMNDEDYILIREDDVIAIMPRSSE